MLAFFDIGHTTNNHTTPTSSKGRADRFLTVNNTAGWEVWTFNMLQQIIQCGIGVIDLDQRGINNLAEVVRWDVGGHTNGNTNLAIQQ